MINSIMNKNLYRLPLLSHNLSSTGEVALLFQRSFKSTDVSEIIKHIVASRPEVHEEEHEQDDAAVAAHAAAAAANAAHRAHEGAKAEQMAAEIAGIFVKGRLTDCFKHELEFSELINALPQEVAAPTNPATPVEHGPEPSIPDEEHRPEPGKITPCQGSEALIQTLKINELVLTFLPFRNHSPSHRRRYRRCWRTRWRI